MAYPYNQPYQYPAQQPYPQYQPVPPRYPTYAPQQYQQMTQYAQQYYPSPVEQMQAAMPPPAPPQPTIEDRVAALEQEIRKLKEALGGE